MNWLPLFILCAFGFGKLWLYNRYAGTTDLFQWQLIVRTVPFVVTVSIFSISSICWIWVLLRGVFGLIIDNIDMNVVMVLGLLMACSLVSLILIETGWCPGLLCLRFTIGVLLILAMCPQDCSLVLVHFYFFVLHLHFALVVEQLLLQSLYFVDCVLLLLTIWADLFVTLFSFIL